MLPRSVKHVCRKGVTLVEAAIVLAIAGIVLGGVWGATSSVNQNKAIDNTLSGVMQTVQALRTTYQVTGRFSLLAGWTAGSDITNNMIAMGIVPPVLLRREGGPAVMETSWGTNMRIVVGTLNPVAGLGANNFDIVFDPATPLRRDVCVGLLSLATGTARDRGLLQVRADGATFNGAALANLNPSNIPACTSLTLTYSLRI